MNCTINQINHTYLLDEDQEKWPDYGAATEMTINSTINSSTQKTPFEFLYGENCIVDYLAIVQRIFYLPTMLQVY